MKKVFRSALLIAGLFASGFTAQAQTNFEGTVVFSIDVNGDALPPEAKAMFAGSEMTVYLKDNLSRTDMKIGPQATTTITDAKAKTAYTLMDMMGQKYKINTKPDEKKTQPVVKELPETKVIAGYTCKKAEITVEGSTEPLTVYYTDAITNSGYNSQIKGIKGYPLQFEMNQGGMKMSFLAKSVTKEKLDAAKFTPDTKDYKETTREELMKSMGR
jgi:GLPGLI family protein